MRIMAWLAVEMPLVPGRCVGHHLWATTSISRTSSSSSRKFSYSKPLRLLVVVIEDIKELRIAQPLD